MADHRISNERKKELEQLDPFQQNLLKGMAWLKEYKKQFILIVGALILVAVVFSGIMYSFKNAENTAAMRVSQVMTQYEKAENPDKGYADTQAEFEAIFSEYTNTTAGKLAKIKFAKICYDASKFDQSYKYYKESLEAFNHDALIRNFIIASLGHVSIVKKEFEQAKKYFLEIENGRTDLLKDEAGFALAMLDETSGNPTGSRERYEKIVKEYQASLYNPIAKSKLTEKK
jgi:predicted negative regulator of RcsB-dependent stress response